jgi:hypothetical protein
MHVTPPTTADSENGRAPQDLDPVTRMTERLVGGVRGQQRQLRTSVTSEPTGVVTGTPGLEPAQSSTGWIPVTSSSDGSKQGVGSVRCPGLTTVGTRNDGRSGRLDSRK